ncbi:MAG: DEAD/DEAH box helicase [Candidatus Heimdallarchaeota archaeon]|nr:DEAD/DEAH box helicase [Candidatus Heimdallarchaeota archaeon]
MIEQLLRNLKTDPRFRDRIEHIQILPEKKAAYGQLASPLPPKLQKYLQIKQIKLYQHQCEAIEYLRKGKNIIITTPTASGKTLAFNLPIFEQLSQEPQATALYLYPTKALSNDQLKVVKELEAITEIKVHPQVYDGDTPKHIRPKIRRTSRIIISNPYELHHVLPWHNKWAQFYSNLQFVVIDEAHHYRGVFGSNVAWLFRRFQRICDFYGVNPQFILSTATLANPVEFGEKLVSSNFSIISKDSSPTGRKFFVFYNPYFDGSDDLSTHQETTNLFLYFVTHQLQTLCFTVSRKMTELITLWSKESLELDHPELVDKIAAYRAGYLPEERREIEHQLKMSQIKGVVSTNALELGIDIGTLDCVILSGYPGTIISTWQQAGRAGREISESIATLVAFQNPLDQFFMKNPQTFFEEPHEHAIINLTNPYIFSGHLLCASAELPIDPQKDQDILNIKNELILEALEAQRLIRKTPHGWVYAATKRATEVVSLNNISSDIFKIICNGKLLETMERLQAYREAHEGAVLLHQGETYLVEHLDLTNRVAIVHKMAVDYYTSPLKVAEIQIKEIIKQRKKKGINLLFGRLNVDEQYIAYNLLRYDKLIGTESLNLPAVNFETKGLWITLPREIGEKVWEKRKQDNDIQKELEVGPEEKIKVETLVGGLHGIEHAMIGLLPFHVMCDRWDLGGLSTNNHLDTQKPTIFVYDGFEGGIGLTEKAYSFLEKMFEMTLHHIKDCECDDGCPACIYSPKCGNENQPLDKKSAILILEEICSLITKS